MSLFQQSPGSYSLIKSTQDEEAKDERLQRRRSHTLLLVLIICIILLCLAFGFASGVILPFPLRYAHIQSSKVCKSPATRREWRSLSNLEKHDYLNAVQCLRTTNSRLEMNQTLYDDFPWIHTYIGGYSHESAAFLAWHRYFLHIYETALKEQCHYKGHLTYWDWTLDWEDIPGSPIWNPTHGFGGNGNISMGAPILNGHCIDNGPFAQLEVLYLAGDYQPHCLSRGFEHGQELTGLSRGLRPESLEDLLLKPNYEDFNLGLEDGPHLSVPRIVRGDFTAFTAPSDPVFFLHHTQLDRIWWMWQHADIQKRRVEYLGTAAYNSVHVASLEDSIPMGGLSTDVKVANIMSTEEGLLCYRY